MTALGRPAGEDVLKYETSETAASKRIKLS